MLVGDDSSTYLAILESISLDEHGGAARHIPLLSCAESATAGGGRDLAEVPGAVLCGVGHVEVSHAGPASLLATASPPHVTEDLHGPVTLALHPVVARGRGGVQGEDVVAGVGGLPGGGEVEIAVSRPTGGGQLVVAGGARVEGGVDLTAGGVTLRVTATMYCTSTEFSSNKTCKGRGHCNRSLVHVTVYTYLN